MPENTLNQAIEELHNVVLALKELIEREYPRREEIEEKFRKQERQAIDAFVSKRVSRQRWIFVLSLAPIMIVSTFFMTITMVSVCFLGTSSHPQVCHAMPGYTDSLERRERRDQLLEDLATLIARNDTRLDEIERLFDQSPTP